MRGDLLRGSVTGDSIAERQRMVIVGDCWVWVEDILMVYPSDHDQVRELAPEWCNSVVCIKNQIPLYDKRFPYELVKDILQ
jgi:hypothetical protein